MSSISSGILSRTCSSQPAMMTLSNVGVTMTPWRNGFVDIPCLAIPQRSGALTLTPKENTWPVVAMTSPGSSGKLASLTTNRLEGWLIHILGQSTPSAGVLPRPRVI